jgi:nicotinamidase-related amidase
VLNRNDTGLIVVDIQGKLAHLVGDGNQVIKRIATLIEGAKALGLPIVWLEQNPTKLGVTVPELATLLAPLKPISKFTFNACANETFGNAVELADVHTWLACGVEAHICVYQTALGLKERGFNVEVVVDSIASRTEASKELAMTKLSTKGVGLTNVEMCLYELVQDCRAPEFKTILNLIK